MGDDDIITVISLRCRSGNIGPAADENSKFFILPDGTLAMTYYDSGILLLSRVEK